MEQWRPIKKYIGYEVSNLGNIRSSKMGFLKVLKLGQNSDGYLTIALKLKYENAKSHYVHVLVAETFVPGFSEGYQACHIDGNNTNNKASNLKWCSLEEIISNKRYHKHCKKMHKSSFKILETGEYFRTAMGLAKYLGAANSTVSYAINGQKGKPPTFIVKGVKIALVDRHDIMSNVTEEAKAKEEWRTVEEFKNYDVSNLGRVRSWRGPGDSPRIISNSFYKGKYLVVCLRNKTRSSNFLLHNLVARAFVSGYSEGLTAIHIDGNSTNVQASNLRWSLPYYRRVSLRIVETGQVFEFSKDLAKHFGVSVAKVSHAINGRNGRPPTYLIDGVKIERAID